MKKFIAIMLVALIVVTGAFAGGSKESDSGLRTVRVAYMSNYASLWSVVAGMRSGAFADQGLEIQLVEFADGPTIIAAMESGSIDIGYIGPVPAINANSKSEGDIQILTGATKGGAILVKREGSDIESVSDLAGKTVAVPQIGNTQHLCLLKRLSDNGLSTVEEGGTVTVTAVENAEGKLEVTLTNTGSVHQMLNSLSVTVTGDDGSEYILSEEDLEPLSGQNLLTDSSLRTVIEMPEVLSGASSYSVRQDYDFSY